MRKVLDSWKYIVKNICFLLPFSVVPAIFLALSLDYTEIGTLMRGFFTGNARLPFLGYFRTLSLVRIDSPLGGIFSALAVVALVIFSALLLSFVEKHMRIGKRTLSGLWRRFVNSLATVTVVALVYVILYELWALLFSALLFWLSTIPITAVFYLLFIVAFLFFTYALLFLVTVFYLWLPCRQMTGFGFYDAFLYSYRLMVGIRWNLILSYLVSFVAALLVFGVSALLPEAVFRCIAVVVFALLFLSFCVRMEIAYFRVDKLDREDLLHSYKEY